MATRKKTSKSILSRAKPVSELEMVITALFYGRSGTGKTTLAGDFPKPLLLLDIGERGTDSLSDQEGIDVLTISQWGELEEVYWDLAEGGHGYKTVVIDAVHTMQGLALQEARDVAGKKEKDQTSQRDFGQASGLMNKWLYHFRDLRDDGVNIVFLAHDRLREVDTEDDETVILPEMGPNLMPGVAKTITGAVNIIGYTFIKEEVTKSKIAGKKPQREVQYGLRIGPNAIYSTKIRKPKNFHLPEYLIDPSYGKLVSVLKGETLEETTPHKTTIRKRIK